MRSTQVIVALVLVINGLCYHFGRRRRRAGLPLTARETVLVMGLAWAGAWLAIGLPSIFDLGRHQPWSDVVPATLALLGLALSPLASLLTAVWLSRSAAVSPDGTKKTVSPHPLD